MSKVFQIFNGRCWWDATPTVGTVSHAQEMFAPDIVFMDVPDFVQEGWIFDEEKTGNERFVEPTEENLNLYFPSVDEPMAISETDDIEVPKTTGQRLSDLEDENQKLKESLDEMDKAFSILTEGLYDESDIPSEDTVEEPENV